MSFLFHHTALAFLFFYDISVRVHLKVKIYWVLLDYVLRWVISKHEWCLFYIVRPVLDAIIPPLRVFHHLLLRMLVDIGIVPWNVERVLWDGCWVSLAPLRLSFWGSSISIFWIRLFGLLGPKLAAFDTFTDFARRGDVLSFSEFVLRIGVLVVQLVCRRIHQNRLFAERWMFSEGRFAMSWNTLESWQITSWPHPTEEAGLALLLGKMIQQKLLEVNVSVWLPDKIVSNWLRELD